MQISIEAKRIPLLEAPGIASNDSDLSSSNTLRELLSPQKITGTRSMQRIAISSPARRTPRATSSPAKRNTLSRAQPDHSKSPSKRMLGPPTRAHNNTSRAHPPTSFTVAQSTVIRSPTRPELPTKSSTVSSDTIIRKPSDKALPRDSQCVSPLKRPARRMHDRSPTILKKNVSKSPSAKSSYTKSKLSSSKPSKGARLGHSMLSRCPNSTSSIDVLLKRRPALVPPIACLDDEDDESKAENHSTSMSFTPIKIPPSPVVAQSPPSEELIDAEEDIWSPSVPMSLTKSFAQLQLTSTHVSVEKEPLPPTTGPMLEDAGPVIYIDCQYRISEHPADFYGEILTNLGAKVLKRWNWNPEMQGKTPSKRFKVGVTHVVFFEGTARSLKKVKEARKMGIHVECVGLSWIKQCQRSQRLTIGTAGHDVDIDEEMSRLRERRIQGDKQDALGETEISSSRLKSPKIESHQEKASSTPKVTGKIPGRTSAMASESDEMINYFSTEHFKPARSKLLVPSVSPKKSSFASAGPTELELRQLEIARRNSAKFRPSVSSPLSKKVW